MKRWTTAGFTVNSTADTNDGFCTTSAVGCTLREAINSANSTAGAQTIDFDIPGSGVPTIQPVTVLPAITEQVTIDGATQDAGSTLWRR